jgi:hypothetical protein
MSGSLKVSVGVLLCRAALTCGRAIDADCKTPSIRSITDVKRAIPMNTICRVRVRMLWPDLASALIKSALYYVQVLEIATARCAAKNGLTL